MKRLWILVVFCLSGIDSHSAREYVRASGQYTYSLTGLPAIPAYPFTVALNLKLNTTTDCSVIAFGSGANSLRFFSYAGATQFDSYGAAGWYTISPANGTNVWMQYTCVFASTTSRTVYLNGSAVSTNTGSASLNLPTNATNVYIAAASSTTVFAYSDAAMAEVAFWNVALTAGEAAALGSGQTPLRVRPASLKLYLPLAGPANAGSEVNISGSPFISTNSPTDTAHPRVYR